MAREHAQIRLDMWSDDDFTELSHGAQWLYLYLLASPSLNYAGVSDWRPARIAARNSDLTAADVRRFGLQLQAGHFIVIDEDTEEVIVRSFVKHDGLMSRPNVVKALVSDYGQVASRTLRAVLVGQLKRLHNTQPELRWEATGNLLEKRSLSIEEAFAELGADPSGKGSVKGSDNPSGKGSSDDGGTLPVGDASLLAPSSLLLTPCSTAPNSVASDDAQTDKTKSASKPKHEAEAFEVFWDSYGKKVGRGQAVKAWDTALKKTDAQTLINAASQFNAWNQRSGTDVQFIANPSTWLNGERWLDERPEPTQVRPKGDQRFMNAMQLSEKYRQIEEAEEQQADIRQIGGAG